MQSCERYGDWGVGAQTCAAFGQLFSPLVRQRRASLFHFASGTGGTIASHLPPEGVGKSARTEPWLPTQPDTAAHAGSEVVAQGESQDLSEYRRSVVLHTWSSAVHLQLQAPSGASRS